MKAIRYKRVRPGGRRDVTGVWLPIILCRNLLRLGRFDHIDGCLVVATIVARFSSYKLGPYVINLKKCGMIFLGLLNCG